MSEGTKAIKGKVIKQREYRGENNKWNVLFRICEILFDSRGVSDLTLKTPGKKYTVF